MRSRLSAWLDPRGIRAAILFAVAAAVANGIWILLDNSAPSWDQSHYLDVTWTYRLTLSNQDPWVLLKTIHSLDPTRGPLFPVVMIPFNYVFGPGPRSGLFVNFCLAPVLYFTVGEIAMTVFHNWRARLLAILLTATVPILVGLYHNVLQDFLLTTLSAIAILLLLRSETFGRRWICVALGATVGFGMLAKVTFPLFLLGPLVVLAIQAAPELLARHREEPHDATLKRIGANAGIALGLMAIIAFPWYISNFQPTVDYIKWTTEPGLGVGPEDPYTFDAVYGFTAGIMNGDVSWVIGLAGLVSLILCIPTIAAWWRRRPLPTETLFGILTMVGWILVPYLSVALAHNQDVRLMAPAIPALTILVAGAMSAIRWRGARIAVIAFFSFALLYQTVNRVVELHPGFVPRDLTIQLGSQIATVHLQSQAISYERLPEDDYATPIIEFLEESVGGREAAAAQSRSLCLLESEPIININTLGYIAHIRGDLLYPQDVFMGPGGLPELTRNLEGCDFALYVRQPKTQIDPRLAVVNAQVAAQYMGPRQFAVFEGPRHTFRLKRPEATEGKSLYLDVSHSGAYVQALVRDKVGQ